LDLTLHHKNLIYALSSPAEWLQLTFNITFVLQGLLPNICKLAPAAGIGWYVFEETKIFLGEDPHT
jgi:hypothetical protein